MLDTADQYDRSIIAVSDPNRYTKSIAGQLFNVPPSKRNTRYPGVSSYTLKNLNGWFASLDDDFMNTAQELMIRDIESRWPNAVIVPCFPTSFTTARAARWNNFSLLDINLLMLDQLNLELDHGFSELPSATGILCHMPVEWHRSVAYLIYAFLQTGRIKVPRLQLMHGVDNYYTSS
jgi:hypothetical protein